MLAAMCSFHHFKEPSLPGSYESLSLSLSLSLSHTHTHIHTHTHTHERITYLPITRADSENLASVNGLSVSSTLEQSSCYGLWLVGPKPVYFKIDSLWLDL